MLCPECSVAMRPSTLPCSSSARKRSAGRLAACRTSASGGLAMEGASIVSILLSALPNRPKCSNHCPLIREGAYRGPRSLELALLSWDRSALLVPHLELHVISQIPVCLDLTIQLNGYEGKFAALHMFEQKSLPGRSWLLRLKKLSWDATPSAPPPFEATCSNRSG